MGMPAVARHWTREEVLALPDDGNRYELVDGELLVSPSPRPLHQIAVAALVRYLDSHVVAHHLGLVLFAPADLDLDAGHLVQPDVFVVPRREGTPPRDWSDVHIPLLMVEVLSPSPARNDRVTKRRLFQRSGIPAYWIVDLDARLVEVWTPGAGRPVIAEGILVWRPEPVVTPLEIDLPALFRRIWGDPPFD